MRTPREVRLRRLAAGLTQRQLAASAGVTQPMIAAIEAGRRTPTAPVRQAIDRTLAVRPSATLRVLTNEVAEVVAGAGRAIRASSGRSAMGQTGSAPTSICW